MHSVVKVWNSRGASNEHLRGLGDSCANFSINQSPQTLLCSTIPGILQDYIFLVNTFDAYVYIGHVSFLDSKEMT